MTAELKAIETRYDGIMFRSRAEARWAVFFNHLGIPYQYELEGFDFGADGWYLPDFYLPKHECWIEIKGFYPPPAERRKMLALCAASRRDVFLFARPDFVVPDMPVFPPHWHDYGMGNGPELIVGLPKGEFVGAWGAQFDPTAHPAYNDDEPDFGVTWGECALCAKGDDYEFFGIDRAQHWQEHFRRVHPLAPRPDVTPWLYSLTDSQRLRAAYGAARSARFEHGANG